MTDRLMINDDILCLLLLGGSVEPQVGCHLVSSVLLDSPVPNYLSHTPRHKGVGVLKR